MHLTTGNTFPRIGKHMSWQIALLACGVAAAVSAAAIAGAFDRSASVTPAAPALPQPDAIAAPANPSTYTQPASPEMVYYLVNSDAEANLLESLFSSEAASMPANVERDVVVAGTPEQQARFQSLISLASPELMANDVGLGIVDLRDDASAAVPTVYVVGSEADKTLLEHGLAGSNANVSVLVLAPGPQSAELYNTVVGEEMATGAFDLVDLRN
jgi:hypothetical protein